MKPIPTNSPQFDCGDDRAWKRSFPVTDFHFQAAPGATGTSSARPLTNDAAHLRSFRKLSSEFFGSETSRNYVREATFFAVISLVSAWPIVTMVRELLRFLR
jgi:hypothetical protein